MMARQGEVSLVEGYGLAAKFWQSFRLA